MAKNGDVDPRTSGKWPVHPHNQTGLDANTNLIAKPILIEFVGAPAAVERILSQQEKIDAIDGAKTRATAIANKAIFPSYLYNRKRNNALDIERETNSVVAGVRNKLT